MVKNQRILNHYGARHGEPQIPFDFAQGRLSTLRRGGPRRTPLRMTAVIYVANFRGRVLAAEPSAIDGKHMTMHVIAGV